MINKIFTRLERILLSVRARLLKHFSAKEVDTYLQSFIGIPKNHSKKEFRDSLNDIIHALSLKGAQKELKFVLEGLGGFYCLLTQNKSIRLLNPDPDANSDIKCSLDKFTQEFSNFNLSVDGPILSRMLRQYALKSWPIPDATDEMRQLRLNQYMGLIQFGIYQPLRRWCSEDEAGLIIERALDPHEDFLMVLSDVDKAIGPFLAVTKKKYDSIATHLAILRSSVMGGQAISVKLYERRTVIKEIALDFQPCLEDTMSSKSVKIQIQQRMLSMKVTYYPDRYPAVTSVLVASNSAYDDLLLEQLHADLLSACRANYPFKTRELVVSQLQEDLEVVGKALFVQGCAMEEIGTYLNKLLNPATEDRHKVTTELLKKTGMSIELQAMRLLANAEGGQKSVKLLSDGTRVVNLSRDLVSQYNGYQYTPREAAKINEVLLDYLRQTFPVLREKVTSILRGMLHLAPRTWRGNLTKWRYYEKAYGVILLSHAQTSFEAMILKNRRDFYARCYLGNIFGIVGLTVLSVGTVAAIPIAGMAFTGGAAAVGATVAAKAAIATSASGVAGAMLEGATLVTGFVAGSLLIAKAVEEGTSSPQAEADNLSDHALAIKKLLHLAKPELSNAEVEEHFREFTSEQFKMLAKIMNEEVVLEGTCVMEEIPENWFAIEVPRRSIAEKSEMDEIEDDFAITVGMPKQEPSLHASFPGLRMFDKSVSEIRLAVQQIMSNSLRK